jgi:predicted MFS family arabinose efflux permease
VNHGATVIAATNLCGGILLGVFLWVASPVVALGVLPVIAGLAAVGGVSVTSLLSTTSPAQAGTTMALNASLLNAGAAIGAAVGGLLIALGGYGALGIGFPAFAATAAILALWPRRPVVSDLSAD